MLVSRIVVRRSSNATFFVGERRSPWYLVAFGMIGASISGVTFVSVPGMVLHSDMTYLQTCMGFILGYAAVAFILLPIYYRLQLTTIYTYLRKISDGACQTGTIFFIISKLLGSAAKFYVPCYIISDSLGTPFAPTAAMLMVLIWLYTRRGGIRTLVWTDVLQTICMLAALLLITYKVTDGMGLSVGEATEAILSSPHCRIFEFGDWGSSRHFLKSFISGIFIVIVMTGLDQDMMQKNLTCKSLRDAQKDMCTYGLAFLPVNLLFLCLGILLTLFYTHHGMPLPEKADELLSAVVADGTLGGMATVLFTIGIVAASFSTTDGSLTALTTCICIDLFRRQDDERLRRLVHIVMAIAMMLCVILFHHAGVTSLIDAVYTLVSYTYGPLLGLFLYAMTTGKGNGRRGMWSILSVCLASPLLCYFLSIIIPSLTGYHFGYELLLLNGMLTYVGLNLSKACAS